MPDTPPGNAAIPAHMTVRWFTEQSDDTLRVLTKRGVKVDFPRIAEKAQEEIDRRERVLRADRGNSIRPYRPWMDDDR